MDNDGTCHGVRIERVNFRENIRPFFREDKRNCPLYKGVRIKRASVERGLTVLKIARKL